MLGRAFPPEATLAGLQFLCSAMEPTLLVDAPQPQGDRYVAPAAAFRLQSLAGPVQRFLLSHLVVCMLGIYRNMKEGRAELYNIHMHPIEVAQNGLRSTLYYADHYGHKHSHTESITPIMEIASRTGSTELESWIIIQQARCRSVAECHFSTESLEVASMRNSSGISRNGHLQSSFQRSRLEKQKSSGTDVFIRQHSKEGRGGEIHRSRGRWVHTRVFGTRQKY